MLSSLSGIGAVVVFKVDRISRKQRHLLGLLEEALEPKNVGFVSVMEAFDTTSPMGKAMLGILGVFSQLERDTIAQRTREALRHQKANGRHIGRAPFGFRMVQKQLVVMPEEMAVVSEVRKQRQRGFTLRRIAEDLNSRGVQTQRGGKWSLEVVRHIVSSPIYEEAS